VDDDDDGDDEEVYEDDGLVEYEELVRYFFS